MLKERKDLISEQHRLNPATCFEPLEPRLLLSGSWGGAFESPAAEAQVQSREGFTQGTVSLGADPGQTQSMARHHQQPAEGRIDLLAQATALKTNGTGDADLDNASPLPPVPLGVDDLIAATLTEKSSVASDPETNSAAVDAGKTHELILVNGDVADHRKLIEFLQSNDSNRNSDVVVLDAERDGIAQVSEILAAHSDLAAVHVLSHGSSGQINLGNSLLNSTSLYQSGDAVATWGSALGDNGDILLYGCNLADSEVGRNLIDELSNLTLADVAASDDLTGHASLGGDWELEYTRGSIESNSLVSEQLTSEYQHTLATITVSSLGDSGAGSLRQAIIDANTNGDADTIAFGVAGTINLTNALPDIDSRIAIDGGSAPGYAGEPLVILNGSGAGSANGFTLATGADGSSVHGLAIVDFNGNGIQVNSGSDGIIITGNWIGTTGNGSTGIGNGNNGINVQGADTIIGGTDANEGNVITNNGNEGINITGAGATGTIIQGNIIGLDPDGDGGSGNSDVGIALLSGAHGTTIGGTVPEARNIISNNFEGIEINSDNNTIQGNYIGTDITGVLDRGNHSDDGIEIQNGATGNLIGGAAGGSGNLIAFNALDGVNIVSGSGNAVLANQIHSNGDLGIDLGAGANGSQTSPTLASAQTTGSLIDISGSLNSTANDFFRIEFFASTGGADQTYLGYADVATDGTGAAAINATLSATVTDGAFISATATKSDAAYTAFTDSSEISPGIAAFTTNTLWITADQDSPSGADGLASWREGEVLQFGGPTLALGSTTDGDFSSAIDFDVFIDAAATGSCDPGALHYVTRDLTIGSGTDQFNLQIGDVLVSFNQTETIQGLYYETGSDTSVDRNSLLAFRPDTPGDFSSGTFYMLLNGVPYPGGGAISNLNAISLVEQDTYVANTLLPEGSFLFSEQTGSGANTPNHIYHFTPTVVGQNPADGTSRILIDGDDIGIEDLTTSYIRGLDLIEKPTTIGGLLLDSGDILVTLNQNDGAVGDAPTLNTATSDIFVLKVGEAEPEAGNTDATAEMVFNGTQVNFSEADGERVYAISLFPDNYGPAVGGDVAGAVTEDVAVVGGNISDTGALTVADPNPGESFFVAGTLTGAYGALTIDAAGAWAYTADNSQVAIQNLDAGDSLTDMFMVTTADGTTQRITITINGSQEPPVARPDGVNLNFDGDDFIQIADDSALQMTDNVTMEAWINHSGLGTGTQIILNKEGEYELGITADTGEIKFAIADAGSSWAWHDTGQFITPGEWTHVAVTFDGVAGEIKTYINGAHVETYAQPGPMGDVYTSYDDLYIGGRQNAVTQRFQGQIDEVRVWSTTRTQVEIQSNMDGLLTGAEPGLAGYWRLDEGSTGAVIDRSGAGNNGTPGGAEGAAATPSYQGYVTNEDTLLNVPAVSGVLANDTDPEGDALTVTNLDTTGMLGNLVLNAADGSFTYDPNGAFESLRAGEHAIETFTYTANDGTDDSNTVSVTITVVGINDAPAAAADSFTVLEGSTTALDLAANDSDADDGLDLASIAIVSGPANGSLVVNGNGTVDYTHDGTETASDSFTYTIDDAAGTTSNTVTVSLTITPQNDAPVAIADNFIVDEGSTTTLDLAVNDSDADDGLDLASIAIVSGPANGSIVVNGDGTVNYTHDGSETASDSFTYTIDDAAGATSNTVTVSLTITPQNDAPVAVADSFTVDEGSTTNLDLAANDSDADDGLDLASIAIVSGPANGSLVVNGNGTVNYTHDGSETASDSFTYTIDDAAGATSGLVTVSLSILPINDTPVIGGDNTGITAEDTDPDADGLIEAGGRLTIVDADAGESNFRAETVAGTYGNLTIDPAGNWTYAAHNTQSQIQRLDAGESMVDTLTVTAADGTTASITITINGAEDMSSIGGIHTGTIIKGSAETAAGRLTITDADASDNPVAFNNTAPVPGDNGFGTFALIAGTWTYTLDSSHAAVLALVPGESFTDSHTFTASDGSTRQVTVTIHGPVTSGNDSDPPIPDQGDSDPGPGDPDDSEETQADPEAPPEEGRLGDDILPPPGTHPAPTIGSSQVQGMTPLHWIAPAHFAPAISLTATDEVSMDRDESPSLATRVLNYLRQHLKTPVENIATDHTAFFSGKIMTQELDRIEQQIVDSLATDAKQGQLVIGAAAGIGASVFVGYVIWAFRGASLLLSALSAMPMWRCFDPLPILTGSAIPGKRSDDEKKSRSSLDDDEERVGELLDDNREVSANQGSLGGKA